MGKCVPVRLSRVQAVAELREVCVVLGCSGMSRDCRDNPHLCSIIRKVFGGGCGQEEVGGEVCLPVSGDYGESGDA